MIKDAGRLAATLACWLTWHGAQAAPTGRLAYIKGPAAWVEPAGGGEATKLPDSDGALLVSLSPAGDAAIYFVPVAGTAEEPQDSLGGMLSTAPFRTATPLPYPLNRTLPGEMVWSNDGSTLYVATPDGSSVYRPGDESCRALNISIQSAARDGSVLAYQTEKETRARWPVSGKDARLFSIGRPQPMFDALNAARRRGNLGDLLSAIDPELWHDQGNWSIGMVALAPDGQAAYFACNAGTSMGASGNCTFAFFVANLNTGKLSVLSTLGARFGRLWGSLQVSPDGTRLLAEISYHNSAVENPVGVDIIDLRSQASREILWPTEKGELGATEGEQANLTDGLCWSPDGRYVAVSTYFYNIPDLLRGDEIKDPTPDDFELRIIDAASGEVVRRIEGAVRPSWSS